MISCTEFIPAYSELFKFIEKKGGSKQAVYDYWDAIFDPAESPLNQQLNQHGLRGCWEYWTHTLNEEAADFVLTLDEENGFFQINMRNCPSKGKLLKLSYLEPFDEYCKHCDLYRLSVEQHGFTYDYDMSGCDHAACVLTITDPKLYHGEK